MKEFRDFARLLCEYGSKLEITTIVVSSAQSRTAERSYGVRIEHKDRDDYTESCFLDFSEILELLGAIRYLFTVAQQLRGQERDYTEFEYSTKDSLRVGFYQTTEGEQRPFLSMSPGSSSMFLDFNELRDLFNHLKAAREHLVQCGAKDETVTTGSSA